MKVLLHLVKCKMTPGLGFKTCILFAVIKKKKILVVYAKAKGKYWPLLITRRQHHVKTLQWKCLNDSLVGHF